MIRANNKQELIKQLETSDIIQKDLLISKLSEMTIVPLKSGYYELDQLGQGFILRAYCKKDSWAIKIS